MGTMFNSPNLKKRALKITPHQAFGFLHQLDLAYDFLDEGDNSPVAFMPAGSPYARLHPRLLWVESVKILEQLLTDMPIPNGGHHALAECLLHGLCVSMLDAGRDERNAALRKMCHLDPVNEIRLLAGEKPVRSLSRLTDQAWEETLDKVFFCDRDWQLVAPLGTKPRAVKRETAAGCKPSGYFSPSLVAPTKAEFKNARARFLKFYDWATKSKEFFPVEQQA